MSYIYETKSGLYEQKPDDNPAPIDWNMLKMNK